MSKQKKSRLPIENLCMYIDWCKTSLQWFATLLAQYYNIKSSKYEVLLWIINLSTGSKKKSFFCL